MKLSKLNQESSKRLKHSIAIQRLHQLAMNRKASPYSDIHSDTLRILDSIYNWSMNGGRWVKLFECGTSTKMLEFTKLVKELMYSNSVLGSSQPWSNGRVFVDFWDEHRTDFFKKVDKLHEEFCEPKTYGSAIARQAFIRPQDICPGMEITFEFFAETGEPKSVTATVVECDNKICVVGPFTIETLIGREIIEKHIVPINGIRSVKR